MLNILYFHPNRKTWTEQKATNIGQEIEECPYCLAIHSLIYKSLAIVWRWDLELPEDWLLPQWERVRLFPVQVPQPILCCQQCDELVKVVPSFILQGTSLTLPALIFVAFAYEFSDLTWRELPQKFCAANALIAHSTLYKAVHGLGLLICSDAVFRKLCEEHLPKPAAVSGWPAPAWPPPKSIYTYTVIREHGARHIGRFLWLCGSYIAQIFDRFTITLERVFVKLNRLIPMLYKTKYKNIDGAADTS